MESLLAWIQASAIAAAMRTSLWMYPVVEIVHILGFILLVGSIAMLDVRLLGWGRALPVRALCRMLVPWSLAGAVLVVPAGLMMFSARPDDFVNNPVFQLKLLLIVVAGINAGLFHFGVYRSAAQWDAGTRAPLPARLHAMASLALWVATVSCGRLLAYT